MSVCHRDILTVLNLFAKGRKMGRQ